jgi:signal transduction histidine kinase
LTPRAGQWRLWLAARDPALSSPPTVLPRTLQRLGADVRQADASAWNGRQAARAGLGIAVAASLALFPERVAPAGQLAAGAVAALLLALPLWLRFTSLRSPVTELLMAVLEPLGVAIIGFVLLPPTATAAGLLLALGVVVAGTLFGRRWFWIQWVINACVLAAVFASQGSYPSIAPVAFEVGFIALLVAAPMFIPLIRVRDGSRNLSRERRVLEARTKQLDAQRQAFSLVSHEMRSSAQAIQTAVEVVEMDVRGRREIDPRLLADLKASASSLARNLADYLTLSRVEGGTLSLRPSRTEIAYLLADRAEIHRPAATAKGLTLDCEATDAQLELYVDHVRLSQVIDNLLTNAIKYTHEGRVILRLVGFEPNRRCLSIEVEDTGEGIGENDLERIFEPFLRSRTAAAHAESFGVGLAVTRSIVGHLGGAISVQSTFGRGSVFRVDVAACEAPRDKSAHRALVFGSDAASASQAEAVVQRHGPQPVYSKRAGDATNLLAAMRFDYVLCLDPPERIVELARDVRAGRGPSAETVWIEVRELDGTEGPLLAPFTVRLGQPLTARKLKSALSGHSTPS